MLGRKNKKLGHFGMLTRKPRSYANTLACKARWHVDHFGTQVRMARDSANSSHIGKQVHLTIMFSSELTLSVRAILLKFV